MSEWDTIAMGYYNALLVPFAPLHKYAAQLLLEGPGDRVRNIHSESSQRVHSDLRMCSIRRILDFGCGPGQPAVTIARGRSVANDLPIPHDGGVDAKIIACDISKNMLKVARIEHFAALKDEEASGNILNMCPIDFLRVSPDLTEARIQIEAAANKIKFDAIVSSLVLMYFPFNERVEAMKMFRDMLNEDGRIVLVFWGEEKEVPWLEIVKNTTKILSERKDGCQESSLNASEQELESGCSPAVEKANCETSDMAEEELKGSSFAMASKEASERLADAADLEIEHWEKKMEDLPFSSLESLFCFLKDAIPSSDYGEGQEIMQALLREALLKTCCENSEGENVRQAIGDGDIQESESSRGQVESSTGLLGGSMQVECKTISDVEDSNDNENNEIVERGRFYLPPSAVVYVVMKRRKTKRKRSNDDEGNVSNEKKAKSTS